jgi:hypothetical protein
MTAIYNVSPIATVEIRRQHNLLILERSPLARHQSRERQELQDKINNIWGNLTLTEKQLNQYSDDADIQYESVPPKRTFTVKARYRFTGRMKPQVYSLDDD